jgi:hypothetical protein
MEPMVTCAAHYCVCPSGSLIVALGMAARGCRERAEWCRIVSDNPCHVQYRTLGADVSLDCGITSLVWAVLAPPHTRTPVATSLWHW